MAEYKEILTIRISDQEELEARIIQNPVIVAPEQLRQEARTFADWLDRVGFSFLDELSNSLIGKTFKEEG